MSISLLGGPYSVRRIVSVELIVSIYPVRREIDIRGAWSKVPKIRLIWFKGLPINWLAHKDTITKYLLPKAHHNLVLIAQVMLLIRIRRN